MKPLLVTSGEPAGVGPELCLALAGSEYPLVVAADKLLLLERAKQLNIKLVIDDYKPGQSPIMAPHQLTVLSIPCKTPSIAGQLSLENANYVLHMLTLAAERCLSGEFSGLVTAPVHKGILNDAGLPFTGHTEFFAACSSVPRVVMMLVCNEMKVALVTTHLPLKDVSAAITADVLTEVLTILDRGLRSDFGIKKPTLYIAGINPHAGEGGYLGREEIDVIIPTIRKLQQLGLDIHGPFPADTMFRPDHIKTCDALVAMYHDQGLPVIKYADFACAVNVTLGLPFVRTSVDHGTALDIAGKGLAEASSLIAAVEVAARMAEVRAHESN